MNDLLSAIASHGDTLGVGAMLVAVLSIILRQLATGNLVFRRQLDELRADKDAELKRNNEFTDKLVAIANERADKFEAAYANEAQAREAQGDTLEAVLGYVRAADYFWRALPSSSTAKPDSPAGE